METLKKISRKKIIALLLVLLFICLYSTFTKNKIILWAWAGSENLVFLDDDIVVAYYAGAVSIGDNYMTVFERTEPLKLQSKTKVIPVVRIDNWGTADDLTSQGVKEIENFIIEM